MGEREEGRADGGKEGAGAAEGPGGGALGFVDPEKGADHYVRRYVREPKYRDWFHRNYPGRAFHRGIGISEAEFERIAAELGGQEAPAPGGGGGGGRPAGGRDGGSGGLAALRRLAERIRREEGRAADAAAPPAEEAPPPPPPQSGEDLARSVFEYHADDGGGGYDRRTFEEFVDERVLVSRDLFGKKEMKIKIVEVSDEIQESKIRWKFGDRVKVNKILVTIKHLDTMEVEEGEFDIEAIEKELAEKRHWSSTNRWIPSADIKNGYVVNSKHTALISDAVALDYIVF